MATLSSRWPELIPRDLLTSVREARICAFVAGTFDSQASSHLSTSQASNTSLSAWELMILSLCSLLAAKDSMALGVTSRCGMFAISVQGNFSKRCPVTNRMSPAAPSYPSPLLPCYSLAHETALSRLGRSTSTVLRQTQAL
jgi:hypothetical protein